MSPIDLWANFLANEKLDPKSVDPYRVMDLVRLCEELAKDRLPMVSPHAAKAESRRLVAGTAMGLGIDLTAIRKRGQSKPAIGRGLLDAWLEVYRLKYGSAFGTAGEREVKRRGVVSRLAGPPLRHPGPHMEVWPEARPPGQVCRRRRPPWSYRCPLDPRLRPGPQAGNRPDFHLPRPGVYS
jgi:hypothetical protein